MYWALATVGIKTNRIGLSLSVKHYFTVCKIHIFSLGAYSIEFVAVLCDRQDIHHMMYESFAGGALCFRIFNGTNQFGCSSKNNLDLGLRIYNLKKVM